MRAVENDLDVMARQAFRNRTCIMHNCFVQGANQMLFECCHSEDDYVTLVPYYGNHHPTHDGSALHVPLLTNPPTEVVDIGSAFMREEFAAFKEKFLGQLEVRWSFSDSKGPGWTKTDIYKYITQIGRFYDLLIPRAFLF